MRRLKTEHKCLLPSAFIVIAAIFCARNERNPAQRPLGRGYHAMAYDAESRRIILFGGQTGDVANHPEVFLSAETWAYDPAENLWQKMSPPASPPAMAAQAMAYDSESDRVILKGGGGASDRFDARNPFLSPDGKSCTFLAENCPRQIHRRRIKFGLRKEITVPGRDRRPWI